MSPRAKPSKRILLMHARKGPLQGRDKALADRAAAPAIRSAFPKVNQLRIALSFTNGASSPAPSSQVHIMHPPSQAYFTFPCPAAGCTGAFDLGPIIDQVVRRSQTVANDYLDCTGVRAENRATGELCALHMRYQIEVSY
jgi:hypothetical protein